jgi:site-specific DNA-methyltransferase (adenine-specific)
VGKIELIHGDCMDYLKGCEDNAFDLAIVDPPYGIERFKNGIGKNGRHTVKACGGFNNNTPTDEYFAYLWRVAKNQIIWGANNFQLPKSEYFVIWDKMQTVDNFASAEYAWVSPMMKKPAKVFRYGIHQHNSDQKKIHPTQKPVKLYDWLLRNYAEPGQRILDTHLGSGSSAIAAHYFGCDFVGCEIDEDYYKAAVDRFNNETAQEALF